MHAEAFKLGGAPGRLELRVVHRLDGPVRHGRLIVDVLHSFPAPDEHKLVVTCCSTMRGKRLAPLSLVDGDRALWVRKGLGCAQRVQVLRPDTEDRRGLCSLPRRSLQLTGTPCPPRKRGSVVRCECRRLRHGFCTRGVAGLDQQAQLIAGW